MKKLLISVIFSFLVVNTFSQSMKYKDIYPYIESKNYREAVPYLKEFLFYEPDHPSANFQLAVIYEERFKRYHPILKFRPAMKNAEEAKMRFLKARLLIDEREIKRNGNKFYTNFATFNDRGKPSVEYSAIRLKIDSAYIEIDNFMRHVPVIYGNFKESVKFYDRAVKQYAEINDNYGSLKELYLLYDASLKSSLAQLKTDYDSSMYFFKAYLKAAENYPITDYKQTFEISTIQHYRLDGLIAQNDFLSEKIIFWDYSSWVDQVNETVSNQIAALRRQIELNEQKLNENIEFLKSAGNDSKPGLKPYAIDRELILKLRNYDYNSPVLPLLLYKQNKQNLMYRAMNEIQLTEDTVNTANDETLLAYFSQRFELLLEGDSLLTAVDVKNTPSNIARHAAYIEKYYYGASGLRSFLDGEKQFTDLKKNEYTSHIRNILIEQIKDPDDTTLIASDKKDKIALYYNLPDSMNIPAGQYFTSHIDWAPDTSAYVGGIVRPGSADDPIQVFLSRVDKANEVLWLNTFTIDQLKYDSIISQSITKADEGREEPTANDASETVEVVFDNFFGAMEITPEGCAILISSIARNSGHIVNTFKLINEKGEEMVDTLQLVAAIPRNIIYNDLSNSFVITYKGNKSQNDIKAEEKLHIIRIDREASQVWQTDIQLTGDVRGIVIVNGGYLVIGNYTFIKNGSGEFLQVEQKSENSAIYVIKIDPKGTIVDRQFIRSRTPNYVDRIVKINDNSINLLGIKGGSNEAIDYQTDPDSITHIITNAQLQLLHSTIDTL